MKDTCQLCGEKAHSGPCYAALREEWKWKRFEEFWADVPNYQLIDYRTGLEVREEPEC